MPSSRSSNTGNTQANISTEEQIAAILIQKSIRGHLGRKAFAKELLQKERGKRRTAKRGSYTNNKQVESVSKMKSQAPAQDVVIVQAVKKQPVKFTTSSQSSTPLIKSNASNNNDQINRPKDDDYFDDDVNMDLHNSVDSLQAMSPSHRKLYLSGIQEEDEDVVRDSLNNTMRQNIFQKPSHNHHNNNPRLKQKHHLADYDDLEDSNVSDSLDMGRQTDRMSAAGTVPWPEHHGRSKSINTSTASTGSSSAHIDQSVRHLNYDMIEEDNIADEERLEDSLEYQIMMKDILSTPRSDGDYKSNKKPQTIQQDTKATTATPSPTKKLMIAPPLSQPPALRANNHQEIITPIKQNHTSADNTPAKSKQVTSTPGNKDLPSDRYDSSSAPRRAAADASASVVVSNNHNNNHNSQNNKHSSSSVTSTSSSSSAIPAPVAAAAAGSKIPLRQVPSSRSTAGSNQTAADKGKIQPRTQVISAGVFQSDEYDDAPSQHNHNNNVTDYDDDYDARDQHTKHAATSSDRHKSAHSNSNSSSNQDTRSNDDYHNNSSSKYSAPSSTHHTQQPTAAPAAITKKPTGPPTIRDLLQVTPADTSSASSYNDKNQQKSKNITSTPAATAAVADPSAEKMALLQKMYAEDVATTFSVDKKQVNNSNNEQRRASSKLDEVNLAMMGLQHSPSRQQRVAQTDVRDYYEPDDYNHSNDSNVYGGKNEEDDLVNLRAQYQQKQQLQENRHVSKPPRRSGPSVGYENSKNNNFNSNDLDNVSVLTDASPYPSQPLSARQKQQLNSNNNNSGQPGRVGSAIRKAHSSNNNNDSSSVNKPARRISFSEEVQRQSPRAPSYEDNNHVDSNADNDSVGEGYGIRYSNNNSNSNENVATTTNNNVNRPPRPSQQPPTVAAAAAPVSSVYHQQQYGGGRVQQKAAKLAPPPQQTQQQSQSQPIMKSQELERKLLDEIAALNRKQLQLQEAHQVLQQQQPSPTHKRPPAAANAVNRNNNNSNNNNSNNAHSNNNSHHTPREPNQQQNSVAGSGSERKAVSAPRVRPSVASVKDKEKEKEVDPVKEKEKKAFGWGARDFKPPAQQQQSQPQQQQLLRRDKQTDPVAAAVVVSPREIVQQWRAAAMHDSGSGNATHAQNNHNSNGNSNNADNKNKASSNKNSHHANNQQPQQQPQQQTTGYEDQYSLRQDSMSLAHVHLESGPGYLQDFQRRKTQQQQQQQAQQKRSGSAQRAAGGAGAVSRRVVLDNGDERSYHSAGSLSAHVPNNAHNKHRSESASLPPLLPYQQHHNLAVPVHNSNNVAAGSGNNGGFVHPFDPPNRRVAQPSSRHSTRSAPS